MYLQHVNLYLLNILFWFLFYDVNACDEYLIEHQCGTLLMHHNCMEDRKNYPNVMFLDAENL